MDYLAWLILALTAGVLLNATPCVLPAVPIKLHVLLAEGGQHALRRLLTGAALLLGSLMFFLSLGALSAAWQWSWGAPMGSPVFRGALAATLALAAALLICERSVFPVPQRIAAWRWRGPAEGFLVGLCGGVLSLPCTGPFLGAVLAFSLAQSPALSLALFAAIGTGMALPYLVLLAVPRWIPRGGLSARLGGAVNRLLGFGLLGGALFYAQQLLPPWLQGRPSVILYLALLAVWAAGAWRPRVPRLERAVAAVAFASAAAVAGILVPSPDRPTGLAWEPVSQAQARPGAVGGPALIEFTADWCINCKVLERTVYRSPEVVAAAGDSVAALQLDLTDFDAEAQALLQAWGGTGLPYAVVLDDQGRVRHRLRDLFGEARLVAALNSLGASTSAERE